MGSLAHFEYGLHQGQKFVVVSRKCVPSCCLDNCPGLREAALIRGAQVASRREHGLEGHD